MAMETLKTLQNHLSSRFLEREDEVRGLMLAAIAREHVLLVGPPGTAKSELARTFAQALGLQHFEWLLTAFSTPEELFGPVDIPALKAGVYRRVTTGKLPEAESAFLDEIFKANSAILNALLSILNERRFHNDGQVMTCPLRFAVCASNELPEEEALRALYDRILLRYHVKAVSDAALRKLIASDCAQDDPPSVDRAELDELESAAGAVKLRSDVADFYVEVRKRLETEGISPSARRLKRSVRLLQANAALEGRDAVEEEDLVVLMHVLWETTDQIQTVRRIVLSLTDPLHLRALELLEACERAHAEALAEQDNTARALESAARIKRAIAELENAKSARVQEAAQKMRSLLAEIMRKCFNMEV